MDKDNLLKAEVIGALLIVSLIGIGMFGSRTTGFIPMDVSREPLNLVIDHSQLYTMAMNESANLYSFSVSGSVSGNGTAYVFLDNRNGQRLLVYSNVQIPQDIGGARFITGMATAEIEPGRALNDQIPLEEGEVLMMGPFVDECVETCSISPDFSSDAYDMVFVVQPGTQLQIDSISYIAE